MTPTRRTVLGALSAAAAGLAAGCRSTDGPTDADEPTGRPTPTDAPTTDRAAYRRRARAAVAELAAGEYQAVYERFSPTVADRLSADQLERSWATITEQYGEFVAVESTEVVESRYAGAVRVRVRFARSTETLVTAFDDAGLVLLRLTDRGDEWTPPAYVDRGSFAERTLTLSAPDGCSLGATLTVPEADGRVPGVVLVHGSGPADRDQTVGPNKVFKDLAWGLASRGVAVLRYDKRTAVCDVDLADVTLDEAVTDDALTALDRLREADEVAADETVVVGHSLGATVAPRVAARDGEVAGVVMLAALARPVTEALLDQNEFLAGRDGEVTDAERERLTELRRRVRRLREGTFPDDEVFVVAGDEYWADLRAYDPVATARELAVPRLLLQGRRDYQVTPEGDFARWREALGGEPGVTLRVYDGLNHLFLPGEGSPGPEEYFRAGHVAERVVADVAAFVGEQV